jgi:hypothetical protein
MRSSDSVAYACRVARALQASLVPPLDAGGPTEITDLVLTRYANSRDLLVRVLCAVLESLPEGQVMLVYTHEDSVDECRRIAVACVGEAQARISPHGRLSLPGCRSLVITNWNRNFAPRGVPGPVGDNRDILVLLDEHRLDLQSLFGQIMPWLGPLRLTMVAIRDVQVEAQVPLDQLLWGDHTIRFQPLRI